MFQLNRYVLALLVVLVSPSAYAQSGASWLGVDVTEDTNYLYAGLVYAFNEDISKNGVLLRTTVGGGEYEYENDGVAGDEVEGDIIAADVMLGYQLLFASETRLTFYLGGNVQGHNLSPEDASNDVDHNTAGVKGIVEINQVFNQLTLGGAASYSSAFDTYWSKFTGRYNLGRFAVGLEGSFFGNEGFDQQRYGVAISDIRLTAHTKLLLAGGQADNSRRGEDGFYANTTLSIDW